MGTIFNRAGHQDLRRELRNNATRAEKALWQYLRKRQREGFKFRRQYGILDYVVDFYCPKLRLIIEVDGEIHSQYDHQENDIARSKSFQELKLHIIRFTNDQVLNDTEVVIKSIDTFINTISSPFVGEVPEGRRGGQKQKNQL